jgi:hypothetical protein
MKFLCVTCDEAMALRRTEGPNEGSMTVVFQCPTCEREIAMLTNSMETQMVRALDIKLGGRSVPSEPMSVVRDALTGSRLGTGTHAGDGGHHAHHAHHGQLQATATGQSAVSADSTGGSKCPFSGAVADAFAKGEEQAQRPYDVVSEPVAAHESNGGVSGVIVWTAEAAERMERIPSYIRPMVRKGIEEYAEHVGRSEVDVALMDEVKGRFGM